MKTRLTITNILSLAIVMPMIALIMGTSCPGTTPTPTPTPQPTTLLDVTVTSPYMETFTPPEVGKVVSLTITGSLSNSRPEVYVHKLGIVAPDVLKLVTNGLVTSNVTTGSFTPDASTVYVLQGQDFAVVGGTFHIVVVQAP